MALIPISAFTPDASIGTSAGPTVAAIALPGTLAGDTVLRVCNIGNNPVAVKLGTTNAVTCNMSTGIVVMPGQELYLGIGANTWLAILTGTPGTSSSLNLTTGN